jgi:hypothetical protein
MAEAATDQKLGTLLRMHERAFRQWEVSSRDFCKHIFLLFLFRLKQ